MSRCYPFPPPGYAGKCSSHEALILSIKLQKERERAISDCVAEKPISDLKKVKSKSSEKKKDKADRKEKKDKEERKKEKREKKKRKEEKKGKINAPLPTDEIGKRDFVDKPLESNGKFERSGVTEEHGRPIDSQNKSCSSDSTGNSSKRKYCSSPSSKQSNGKKIRIRILSPPVKDEPSKPAINEQQPVGFTSHIREDRPASQSLVRPCDSVVRLESSIKPKNAIPLVRGIPKNATTSQLVSRRCVVKPESSIKPKNAIPIVQGSPKNATTSQLASWPCGSVVKPESSIKQKDAIPIVRGIPKNANTSQPFFRPCGSVVKPESSIKQKDVVTIVQEIPKNATTSQLVSRHCGSVVKPESSIKPKDAIPVVQGIQNNAPSQSVSVDTTQLIEKTNASHDKGKSRESSVKLSSHDKRMLKNEAMRKNLFVNWAPPTLIGCDVDYDDEDWLFSKKDEDRPSKRARVDVDNTQSSTDNLPCSASVIQPRAQLLAEVGIHALPFTVPF
ncbi:uncharacterized protein LOC130810539 isoform X2 [Amaranthus tricolor]|uniref:uncharacterized protein LOC130810539 isoform X2 n=1 Tax=Amaranthus tricolor TaxID=29722 RepID=UPI00258E4CF4|nr:uncharacterized protein LOC130810539 isoform X2 [Amaranthus tricolor]